MKKIICALLALCLFASLFTSCAKKSVKLSYNDENLLVSENGAVYKYAPVGYEPTNQGEEYGVIESVRTETVYRIGEIDPEKWITTEYTGATTTVYYSADITLPSIGELEPELCYICEEGESVFAIYTMGSSDNGRIDAEREEINAVIDLVLDEDTEPEMWPRVNYEESYSLKLYSEKWPAIYYCLDYVREGGVGYIYDPVSRKCVLAGDLLEGYFTNEAVE